MSASDSPIVPTGCGVHMRGFVPCGRPIYIAAVGVDPEPVCLMHSRDPNKDKSDFRREVDAILNGTSKRCPKDRFDFTHFIFPEADFYEVTFTQNANFVRATFTQRANFFGAIFTQDADFHGATFTQDADFHGATFMQDAEFSAATFTKDADFVMATFEQDADFSGATFTQNADFFEATFTQDADFHGATFMQDAEFSAATFTKDADFRAATFTKDASFERATFGASANFTYTRFYGIAILRETHFQEPRQISFLQTNCPRAGEGRDSAPGLRASVVNCDVEQIRFEDVNWHRQSDRMLLQDELDIIDPPKEKSAPGREQITTGPESYELVAIAYRRMVSNAEKTRNYDLAEDCYVGAMEMKRLDPMATRSSRAIVTLYKWLSVYGSSYTRALGMLGGFLLAFALLFPVFGLRMTDPLEAEKVQCPLAAPGTSEASVISWSCAWGHRERIWELWGTFKAGLLAAAETATFQRRPTLEPANNWGRAVAMSEVVVIPGQLALLFLALRRRFRR